MKREDDDDSGLHDGHFQNHTALKTLERQLVAHIHELGDLRKLSSFEQVLYCVLSDQMDEDLALDLSRMLVTQAVERVVRDPMRDIDSVPYGISRAERFAAFFEEGCPFCEAKSELESADPEDHDDDCACCTMLAREWRAKHATALRKLATFAKETRA